MNQQNITPNSTERFVQARLVRPDGTVEIYSNYMASDQGRIGSLVDSHGTKRHVMKILKPWRLKKGKGYLQVSLCVDGKRLDISVHRLVLSSFQPELWSIDANEVDHIDRDPTNNHLVNLRWTDKNGNNANRSIGALKRIRVTHLSGGHTDVFDNMCDCSKAFGKAHNWCNNIIREHDGFNAKYNILIEKI